MHNEVTTELARANPVPDKDSLIVDTDALLRDARGRIDSRSVRNARRPPRWRIAVVALAAAGLAVVLPTLAFSGVLGDLFEFSSQGTTPTKPLSSTSLSALESVGGEPGSVRLLATRAGKAFYAAHSASGGVCVGIADADAPSLSFTHLQCSGGGDASFPSPTVPVLLASPTFGRVGSPDVFMKLLAGFAADAVSRVVLRGPSGVVASALTEANVFAVDVPHAAVTEVDAYDSTGQQVWEHSLVQP